MQHQDIRKEYLRQTSKDTFRVTSQKTLVWDEEYVEWLEKRLIETLLSIKILATMRYKEIYPDNKCKNTQN